MFAVKKTDKAKTASGVWVSPHPPLYPNIGILGVGWVTAYRAPSKFCAIIFGVKEIISYLCRQFGEKSGLTKAFAIISRSAKSVGNLLGIKTQ